MPKAFLITCFLVISYCAYGQYTRLGITGGVNTSTFISSGYTEEVKAHFADGLQGGLFTQFVFNRFYIQPGVQFSTINSNNNYIDAHGGVSGIDSYRLNYLQVPVNIFVNIVSVPFGKIFFGGGPYIGFGLSGKLHSSGVYQEENVFYSDNFTSRYNFMRSDSPDYGLNLATGVQFKNKLSLSVGYLTSLKSDFYQGGIKINSFNVSLGYSIL